MPETAEAPVENEQQQAPDEAPAGDDRTQAHDVEFPEAPEDAASGSAGQLDVLLDMDVPVTVVLGTTEISVRQLLQVGPGAVLKLEKPIAAPADLFLRDSKFAEAEVVVVENQFAVRIKQITGAGATGRETEG